MFQENQPPPGSEVYASLDGRQKKQRLEADEAADSMSKENYLRSQELNKQHRAQEAMRARTEEAQEAAAIRAKLAAGNEADQEKFHALLKQQEVDSSRLSEELGQKQAKTPISPNEAANEVGINYTENDRATDAKLAKIQSELNNPPKNKPRLGFFGRIKNLFRR